MGDDLVHFTLDEKVQKRKTDRLTLPATLGQLLRIWIEKYRSIIVAQDSKVVACFVNKSGKPLSKIITLIKNWSLSLFFLLVPRRITEFVKKKVGDIFPGRHITPLSFRRILVTEMALAASENPTEFFQWAANHAVLINTSDAMMVKNYNRGNQNQRSFQALQKINSTLALDPSEDVQALVKEHAADVTYLQKESDKLLEVVDMRYEKGVRQYLCKFADGEEDWKYYSLLAQSKELVTTYLMKTALAKRKIQNPNADVPELETDFSDSDLEQYESNSDCEVPIVKSNMNIDVAEVLQEMKSGELSPKRKRTVTEYFEDLCLDNNEVIKPGDVISVNPEDETADFWLAKVISISSIDQLHVQWLDKHKQSASYTLKKLYDDVDVGAVNGLAQGTWQTKQRYELANGRV